MSLSVNKINKQITSQTLNVGEKKNLKTQNKGLPDTNQTKPDKTLQQNNTNNIAWQKILKYMDTLKLTLKDLVDHPGQDIAGIIKRDVVMPNMGQEVQFIAKFLRFYEELQDKISSQNNPEEA